MLKNKIKDKGCHSRFQGDDNPVIMIMGTDYVKRSEELFLTGCNCSESVFAAFADRYGIDTAAALKMSIGLGGGIGRMREVCGAVSAAAMVLGLEYGNGAEGGRDKPIVYEKVQQFCTLFNEKYPSLVCRDLLGNAESGGTPTERNELFYKIRPCPQIIKCAVEILTQMIDNS